MKFLEWCSEHRELSTNVKHQLEFEVRALYIFLRFPRSIWLAKAHFYKAGGADVEGKEKGTQTETHPLRPALQVGNLPAPRRTGDRGGEKHCSAFVCLFKCDTIIRYQRGFPSETHGSLETAAVKEHEASRPLKASRAVRSADNGVRTTQPRSCPRSVHREDTTVACCEGRCRKRRWVFLK